MSERSPDEIDADVDAERLVDEDVDDLAIPVVHPDRDPDETDVDVDAERVVGEQGDDLYEEPPDLGDFEGNLNA
jgi:hypothetical protein